MVIDSNKNSNGTLREQAHTALFEKENHSTVVT